MRSHACLALLLCAWSCRPSDESKAGVACKWYGTCEDLACVAAPDEDPEDLAPLNLECGETTRGAAPGEACEAATDCGSGVCLLSGACAEPCDPDIGCMRLQRCASSYARTATDALQLLHACVDRVNLPKDAAYGGSVEEDVLEGEPNDVDLRFSSALPVSKGATLFVLEHASDDSWPAVTSCRSPLCALKLSTAGKASRVLFDVDTLGEATDGPDNPIANDMHVYPMTVLVPNGTRDSLSAGGYELRVENSEAGDLRITQLQRERSGERLDLNVFYVGAQGFEVTGARGPKLLADALDEVDEILGQADIFIGDVRQIEVTGKLPHEGITLEDDAVKTTLANLSPRFGVLALFPRLLQLSVGAGNVALNIFFVADIEMPPGIQGDIHALSGGTPVPWGMHGTSSSGIVVATDMMVTQNDAKAFGRTLAHEIGHALGLFHTTETRGLVLDPIDDTPVCPPEADENGNGLEADECTDAGGDNLMFPTNDTDATLLTPDQRAVLRRALILQ